MKRLVFALALLLMVSVAYCAEYNTATVGSGQTIQSVINHLFDATGWKYTPGHTDYSGPNPVAVAGTYTNASPLPMVLTIPAGTYVENLVTSAGDLVLNALGPVTITGNITALGAATINLRGDITVSGVETGTITLAATPAGTPPVGLMDDTPGMMPLDRFPVPWSATPVAVRCDDAFANLSAVDSTGVLQLTGSAGAVNVSPLEYAHAMGVPMSLSVPISVIGTTGYMTAANIKDAYLMYGHEIVCHTYNHHAYSPADMASLLTETLSAKQYLENLTATTASNPSNPGLVVRGFVMPGEWTHIVYGADVNGWIGLGIRKYFQWSLGYTAAHGRLSRHFGQASDTMTNFSARYTSAPTMPTIFECHSIAGAVNDSTHNTPATFKGVIDTIAGWAAAGSVTPVTLSGFFGGYYQPGTTGVQYGDFEGMSSVNTNILAISSIDSAGGNPTRCGHINASAQATLQVWGFVPGRVNMLKIDVKCAAGACLGITPNIFIGGASYYLNPSPGTELKAAATDWTTYYRAFGIPKNCDTMTILLTETSGAGAVQIDNISVYAL